MSGNVCFADAVAIWVVASIPAQGGAMTAPQR
jgi:hypothetical protein